MISGSGRTHGFTAKTRCLLAREEKFSLVYAVPCAVRGPNAALDLMVLWFRRARRGSRDNGRPTICQANRLEGGEGLAGHFAEDPDLCWPRIVRVL